MSAFFILNNGANPSVFGGFMQSDREGGKKHPQSQKEITDAAKFATGCHPKIRNRPYSFASRLFSRFATLFTWKSYIVFCLHTKCNTGLLKMQ